jgi:hypothetical protein
MRKFALRAAETALVFGHAIGKTYEFTVRVALTRRWETRMGPIVLEKIVETAGRGFDGRGGARTPLKNRDSRFCTSFLALITRRRLILTLEITIALGGRLFLCQLDIAAWCRRDILRLTPNVLLDLRPRGRLPNGESGLD